MKKFLTTYRSLSNSKDLEKQAENLLPQAHLTLYMTLLCEFGLRPDEVRALDISELDLRSK